MSKRSERKRARQMHKYQQLRRKRGTWRNVREDMLAAFGRVLRGSFAWHGRSTLPKGEA